MISSSSCQPIPTSYSEYRRIILLRVFENRVLRRIFGPRRDEVTEEWRKLHNEEPNELYSPSNIVQVIKSRRMRWAGHVWVRGEACTGFWWGNLRERPLGRPRHR
jgi:hypothetical protein